MNWNEFKDIIDKQMSEKGISPDDDIWFIDTNCYNAIEVESDEAGVIITDNGKPEYLLPQSQPHYRKTEFSPSHPAKFPPKNLP